MRRPARRNPAGVGVQILIGIATAVASSVLAAFLIDAMREARRNEALPQPVAPGWDRV